MATEALLSQLMYSDEFIASHNLVLKQNEADAVIESMVDALIHQINNMPGIDTPTATKLNTAIQQSAYKPELQGKLVAAVSARAVCTAHSLVIKSTGKPRKDCQIMMNPLGYFKQAAWAYWEDPTKTPNQKVMYMAGECNGLNLLHPKPKTVKRLMAVLAALIWPSIKPPPKQLYAMVLDLKNALDQYNDSSNTHLLEYPLSPHDLPDDLKHRAYNNDLSTLEQKQLPNYAEYISLVICRKNHRCLQDHCASSQLTHTPCLPISGGSWPSAQPGVQHTPPMCGMAAPHVPQPSQHHTTDTNTGLSTVLGHVLDRINHLESTQLQKLQHSNSSNARAFLAGGVLSEPSTPEPDLGAPQGAPKGAVHGAKSAGHDADDSSTSEDAAAAKTKVGALEKLVLDACTAKRKRGRQSDKTDQVKKKPAASSAFVSKDMKKPPPDDSDTIHWGGGKIYVSSRKQSYRVIPRYGIKSDTPVCWSKYPSKQEAWNAALKVIEDHK